MNLDIVIRDSPRILMDGEVLERLRRENAVSLDPDIMHAALVYDDSAIDKLSLAYRDFFDIATRFGLPLIATAPTFRSGLDRVSASRFAGKPVNRDCVRFLRELRDRSSHTSSIYVAGVLGPRNLTYNPREPLPELESLSYHALQALELAAGGADLILGLTLSSLSEALGMSRAIAAVDKPFGISFLVDRFGKLPDGTPLVEAIQKIDEVAPPTFFMLNCCHPSVAYAAIELHSQHPKIKRLIGVKANTSSGAPSELEGLPNLDCEQPHIFANALCRLYDNFGIRMLGGCCGSEAAHIEVLAHTWSVNLENKTNS